MRETEALVHWVKKNLVSPNCIIKESKKKREKEKESDMWADYLNFNCKERNALENRPTTDTFQTQKHLSVVCKKNESAQMHVLQVACCYMFVSHHGLFVTQSS